MVVATVTINKMSAGKGYEYLLRTVAAGDGDRSLSTPLTRYYTEAGQRRHAVAGYDLTFSIPKSASVLWGVADGGAQALIAEAHHAAVVAAAFDHYDSRANDPHLHTHVVISNKVKTVRDGQWRAVDDAVGRAVPAHGSRRRRLAWVVNFTDVKGVTSYLDRVVTPAFGEVGRTGPDVRRQDDRGVRCLCRLEYTPSAAVRTTT